MATSWDQVRQAATLNLIQATRLKDIQDQKLVDLRRRRGQAFKVYEALANKETLTPDESKDYAVKKQAVIDLDERIAPVVEKRERLIKIIEAIAASLAIGVELDPSPPAVPDAPGPGNRHQKASDVEVQRVLEECGNLPEAELGRRVRERLSGKQVSRQQVREIRQEVFGPINMGRPKKSPN